MTSHRRSRHSGSAEEQSASASSFWNDPKGVSPAVFVLGCLVFGSGLILGGSGGSFGDTIVQLLSLPLIVLAAMHWSRSTLCGPDRAALAIIAGIVVLAFVQLVPLPLSMWASLPGRADLLRELQSVGVTPAWQSISLNPLTTERALQWTLPAIAMFLAVRWMSSTQRKVLLMVLFVGAIALLMLTLTQRSGAQTDVEATANEALAKANLALSTASAPNAPARGQFITGLFSNRNHFATFLAMTIPLVVAMGVKIWLERKKNEPHTWVPWSGFLTLVIVGLLVGMFKTQSRAALVLGGMSLLGSLMLLRHLRLNRTVIWGLVAATFAGALATFIMAGSATVARLDASPTTDMRWIIHGTTLEAARHFGPLGSGLGTFVQAYQTVQPEKDFGPKFVNRAHGDYHELWLETGVPGALLILGFLGWFGWSAWLAWRDADRTRTASLIARAATLSIVMALMHSYLDYPLRKTTILVIFGMSCALLASNGDAKAKLADQPRIRKA